MNNSAQIMTVFFCIAGPLVGFVISYIPWSRFFTNFDIKINFRDIKKKQLLLFLIPVLYFTVVSSLSLTSLAGPYTNEALGFGFFTLMPFLTICSILLTNLHFFRKWKKSQDPQNLPLETYLKSLWPDLVEVNTEDVDDQDKPEILLKYEKKIRDTPHLCSQFMFFQTGLFIETLVRAYISYLAALNHKLLTEIEYEKEGKMLKSCIICTTDGVSEQVHFVDKRPDIPLFSISTHSLE